MGPGGQPRPRDQQPAERCPRLVGQQRLGGGQLQQRRPEPGPGHPLLLIPAPGPEPPPNWTVAAPLAVTWQLTEPGPARSPRIEVPALSAGGPVKFGFDLIGVRLPVTAAVGTLCLSRSKGCR